ncbi:MAG: zf-HC2 domain-containing protein, partial [Chloroflexota bacterium]|nr:zf-HC2 domain-containing protein [Chloroflexota bacterium]
MNHQPFETWILLETKLTPAQKRELQNHLRTCPQCRRLSRSARGIAYLFTTTPAPYPLPGFATRWKKRLDREEQGKKNLLTWTTLSALTLTVLLTMIGLSTQIAPLSEHFPQLLMALISQATHWINFVMSLQNIFSPLFRVG